MFDATPPDFLAAKSLQSCLTLCDPRDGSPPSSLVPGILQARTLEWVAISFSNAQKWKVKVKSLSHIRPLATPWTAPYQAPPSIGFSRQDYWSGVPLPSPPNFLSEIHLKFTSLNEFIYLFFSISSVQSLSCVRLFATPWTAACQASLSITNSQSLLKFMSMEMVMPSNHFSAYSVFNMHSGSIPKFIWKQNCSFLFFPFQESHGGLLKCRYLGSILRDFGSILWGETQ